ncbi:ficolin-2-like [Mercenaria mercenaria]|uniref:ficolin-2-like n=1 Tax=Mercenaria mercenaria TaxID=6596 RepID=UPI00234F3D44|nr:ficolin-2-like [Mercenaria mercenaria]
MLWRSKQRIEVYCDMDIYPYGWTVFQKRFNGSVDFYRNFTEYTDGFGNLRGEFWLGLRYIEEMTSQYESELRLDVVAADSSHAYEVFQNFSLSKYPKYTLHLGKKTVEQISNRTNGFSYSNGSDFSTFDHDADQYNGENCGQLQRGGWWFVNCSRVNLNGEYLTPPGGTSTYYYGYGGFIYYLWKQFATLKSSQIMFRKHT